MEANEFLKEVEKIQREKSTVDLDRWLSGFKDLQLEMAKKIIVFARYFDSIPSELREKYIETLLTTLDSVPLELKVTTSATLREKLTSLIPSIDSPSKEKLTSALEKHVLT